MILPRKSVLSEAAYRPPLEGRRGRIRMDFNENTTGLWKTEAAFSSDVIAAYPEYGTLLRALASFLGVGEENLLLTNASGEALFLASFTFLEPGADRALTSRPTFALIPHYIRLVGAELMEIPATSDLEFDVPAIETALEEGVKLAVFASPDNPTGATLEPARLLDWCERFPGTLFLVDEAYSEYTGSSVLPDASVRENLLVLRTFSKAWAMAGLRLGVMVGNPSLLQAMRKVRCPYSVNAASVSLVERMIPRSGEVLKQARATMERKKGLIASVENLGIRTVPGKANFFLLMAGVDAGALCAFLRKKSILVRDRSGITGLEGAVRVTVGTGEENRAFLEALETFQTSRGLIFDLDDTIVDTSRSYDDVIGSLVQRYTGSPLSQKTLTAIRGEEGFNDDWDTVVEILRRRGVPVARELIEREGKALYLKIAGEREALLIDARVLRRLAERYRLFLLTGRPRDEYAPIWGEELDDLFEAVVCRDDDPDLPPKPAPDQLRRLLAENGLSGGTYVGNSVDDMAAAEGAGLRPVAVATTIESEILEDAGAELVLRSPGQIEEVFLP
ncbi:MAG: aminotransferase class I/II-fold pyridoxal phosphate-dependent enzyme [Planctomycetota bacterium]|jgi:histidinol-phosphate aminotransferase